MATKFIVPTDGLFFLKGEYYVNTVDCETLTKMKFNGFIWYPDGSVCYEIDEGNSSRLLKHTDIINVYASESDYEKRKVVEKKSIDKDLRPVCGHFRTRTNRTTNEDGIEVLSFRAYIFEDNEPKCVDVDMKYIKSESYYTYICGTDVMYYESEKQCIDCNDYSVTDEKGTRIVKSPYKKLMLDDEQEKALEEFRTALNNLKEHGIQGYLDTDDYQFYFINKKELSDLTMTDCDDFTDEMLELNLNNPLISRVRTDFPTYYGCDYSPAVKFKD